VRGRLLVRRGGSWRDRNAQERQVARDPAQRQGARGAEASPAPSRRAGVLRRRGPDAAQGRLQVALVERVAVHPVALACTSSLGHVRGAGVRSSWVFPLMRRQQSTQRSWSAVGASSVCGSRVRAAWARSREGMGSPVSRQRGTPTVSAYVYCHVPPSRILFGPWVLGARVHIVISPVTSAGTLGQGTR
jgi:hypothetical protein